MVRAWSPPARDPGKILGRAPLDDGHVDLRERELGRQHQPGRAAPGDHHRVLDHQFASPRARGLTSRGVPRSAIRLECGIFRSYGPEGPFVDCMAAATPVVVTMTVARCRLATLVTCLAIPSTAPPSTAPTG